MRFVLIIAAERGERRSKHFARPFALSCFYSFGLWEVECLSLFHPLLIFVLARGQAIPSVSDLMKGERRYKSTHL